MFSNVLICEGVVVLQSVLKPIRGDSDYRPTSEHNDDEDDNDTAVAGSAQRVPEPNPLPGISLDTRPDPIQF